MYIIEMRGNNVMRVDKLICLLCISEREREREIWKIKIFIEHHRI